MYCLDCRAVSRRKDPGKEHVGMVKEGTVCGKKKVTRLYWFFVHEMK